MTWDKPNTPAKWLLLFAPPAMCVVATVIGGLVDPKNADWMGWALVGLLLATISSFALSIKLALKNDSFGAKLGCFIICFVIYMVVNGAVSFAGCAAGSAVFSPLRID